MLVTPCPLPPTPENLLAALAVLGSATPNTLAALLNAPVGPEAVAQLIARPDVQQQAANLTLLPEDSNRQLNDLAEAAPARFQNLHERALTQLAAQITAALPEPNPNLEEIFIAILDRLVNFLRPHDPKILAELIVSIQATPLQTNTARYSRSFFEAFTLSRQDRHQEAIRALDSLLTQVDLALVLRGRALNIRAICLQVLGDWEEARAGFLATLAGWQQMGDRLNEGKALLNLGILAYQLQEYSEAEERLSAARNCFVESKSAQLVGSVDNELGLVYRDQGRWAEALHYFRSSTTQAQNEGAVDALAIVLLNIGEVLLLQGQFEQAQTTLEEVLVTIPTRLFLIDTYLSLGMVRQVAGDLASAQSAYENALTNANEIGRRDILGEIYFRLGEVYRRQGEDATALAHFEQAAQVIESTRQPMHDEGLKISLLGRWQQIYETLVLHCLYMGQPELAWQWAERARARAFAEQLATDDTLGDQGEVATLAEVQDALPANALLLNYFVTGVLDNQAPFLRMLTRDNPLREHLLTPPRTLLFAIDPHGLTVHQQPVDPNAFASTSRRHEDRSRLLAPKTLNQFYKVLLPAALPSSVRQLYLVPHGPLHHVPFGALLDATGEALLHAGGPSLAYAPSATILRQQLRGRTHAVRPTQRALCIGYVGAAEDRQLRHTASEAQWIAQLTGGEAWVGAQPKKAQLAASVADYRWLHFACHGWFNYDTPLASYLEIGADEHLTAEEVLQTWRLQAELVTLSACQTGVHRLLRSDEPIGLIRAFLTAGARSVLASQWPVEDLPTFLLMQKFYEQLVAGGVGVAVALQHAQIWLRTATQEMIHTVRQANAKSIHALADDLLSELPADPQPFAHPRYWAGFVVFGG